MKYDLEPARKVLKAFLAERDESKAIRQGISAPSPALAFGIEGQTPIFEASEFTMAPDSFWEKDDAYGWLCADPYFWRRIVNYSYKMPRLPIPEYYSQSAAPVYQQWREEEKEVFHRKCVMIPEPEKEETLIAYLQRLESAVSDGNEHRDVWIESLRSFLQFLRDDTELDQKGPLEVLFPSKEGSKGMEIRQGYTHKLKGKTVKQVERRVILRRIEDTVYPIDILAAAEIVENLVDSALNGRTDSQRSTIEALAFAWLCLAVGFRRMATREELVFSVTVDQLYYFAQTDCDEYFKPTHFIKVASLFGLVDVPISKTLYELLFALPRDEDTQRVFSMDWSTILRTFRRA
ncbi:MAG: hypothetical protein JSR93_01430, partial [Verrucomicrobia bacterium]|nr:hypothetical protein [Verrucomicrobiota bacterium]